MSEKTPGIFCEYKRILAVFVAAALLFSFALHDIQVSHTHHHGEGAHHSGSHGTITIADEMHAADRKIVFVVVLSIFLFVFSILTTSYVQKHLHIIFGIQKMCEVRIFDLITMLFRKGILHPKLCG